MKKILAAAWQKDKKKFLLILFLNIATALTSSISVVMLIPLLDLLEVSVGDESTLGVLLQPFAGMSYMERSIVIIVAYIVLMLIQAALKGLAKVKENVYLEQYERELRTELYNAISTSNWEVLSAKNGTDLLQLIVVQCRQARTCLHVMISLLASSVTALLQLAIAVWMSLPVTLVALAVGIGFLFIFRPFTKKSKAFGKQAIKISRELHREVQNQLNSIKEIRAYGVQESNAQRFEEHSQKSYDTNLRMVQLQVFPQFCYSVASAVLIALAFVYSVLLLNTGTAQLVVLVYVISRLWPIFSSWQSQLQTIQTTLPAYETIKTAVTDLQEGTCEPEIQADALKFEENIAFDQVCFTYRNGSEEVLQDLEFTLPCGSVTALVGPSGAGKSTTADLLLGLLQPTKGQILVDGVPLTKENLGAWRKAIGYIPQEPLVINTTIRDNLLRFHPEATEEEMIDALKRSLAWPFVEKLPNGLDTVLGDKGTRLSGGERQRIVLARVLLGNPRFIILDEATSALDYESETFIRETIRSLRNHTTVLVIAHRMATIRGADRAVVILHGKIAEQGSLQELLQKENSYLAKMVSAE